MTEKHHQCKLHKVKTILGTSRSRMQEPTRVCLLVQAAFGCQLAHLHTNVHKHIGALCNLHCVVRWYVYTYVCVCVCMRVCVCVFVCVYTQHCVAVVYM